MANHVHDWLRTPTGVKRCSICGQRRRTVGPVEMSGLIDECPRIEPDASGLAGRTTK